MNSHTTSHALNIMVVEDHQALREVTVEALGRHGHNVRGVDCAEALPDVMGLFPIDILVIDLNLPGEDGISLASRIRDAQPEIGIIMVTARNQIRDRTVGYENGADIYLTKPTSTDELIAAVSALSRRIHLKDAHSGAFVLGMTSMTLAGPKGTSQLSIHEVTTLAAFVRAQNQQLDTWQLIGLTDRGLTDVSKKALEVQMVRLRKKLQQTGACDPTIKSIRGQGYKLCIKVSLVLD